MNLKQLLKQLRLFYRINRSKNKKKFLTFFKSFEPSGFKLNNLEAFFKQFTPLFNAVNNEQVDLKFTKTN